MQVGQGDLAAQADPIASGICGTCNWQISQEGELSIWPSDSKSGVLPSNDEKELKFYPWAQAGYSTKVTSIKVLDGVSLEGSAAWLFGGEISWGPYYNTVTADLSGFDLSKVTSAYGMFSCNHDLESVTFGDSGTPNMTDMAMMFHHCKKLSSADLSGFDTSKVTSMEMMFWSCSSLATVDVSTFNTSNVKCAAYMFCRCALTTLDLSSFDLSKAEDVSGMLSSCQSLKTIYASELWNVAEDVNGEYMFSQCEALVGGNGTVFDPEHDDEGYARVDAEGAPGYLTYKAAPEPEPVEGASMHRLYNAWSGEHFYTSDDAEYAGLVELGWKDEGEGWKAPETSNTPVFRMYNPYAGEHHYTMDASEKDSMIAAGWVDEGVGWYSDDAKTVPLFREYNPNEPANNHNYTTNAEEHAQLIAAGWRDEGYAWYGI